MYSRQSPKSWVMNKRPNLRNCLFFYHRLTVYYKWKYKRLKKILLFLNMVSISLTVAGTGLAPITHYTSLSMNGCGVFIQGYISKGNISENVQQC